MEIEISRTALASAVSLILAGVFLLTGLAVTPRGAEGEPLVLSPSYLDTLDYLKAADGWLADLEEASDELDAVMGGGGDIYRQGKDAERTFMAMVATAREVGQTEAPPSLVGLQTGLSEGVEACVAAAQQTLVAVGAPTKENRQAALAALQAARSKLAASRALKESLWPEN